MEIHLVGWTAVIMHAAKPLVYLPFKCKKKKNTELCLRAEATQAKEIHPSVQIQSSYTTSTSLNCFSLAAIYGAENFKASFHIL